MWEKLEIFLLITEYWCLIPLEKLDIEMSMEMSFSSHALLRRSDAYEEHGDVFFWYARIYS